MSLEKKNKRNIFGKCISILNRIYLPLLLLISIAFFSIITDNFLSVRNLTNIFLQNSYLVIATMGIAIVMISGGVDLSVSYQIGLVAVVVGKLLQFSPLPFGIIIIIGLFVGLGLGIINGLITTALHVHPMVATLATMSIFQGTAYVFCDGLTFYGFPEGFKFIGQGYLFGWLPMCVVIMAAVFIVAYILLTKTYLGRHIYSLGGNEETTRLAGINVVFVRILAFAISGVFLSVASMVLTARLGNAMPNIASDALFTAISACVLGGISFSGGSGNIPNMFISVMILGVLSNGMQIMGLNTYSQYVMKGTVLALAIAFDNYQKKAHVKELTEATTATVKNLAKQR
ncbi:MAG: ABC transporter permease [Treponema sp.]|jgi:ribose/xylose/arabinose/galactoside ABC-type transport system permease subunit|nr:ABC transporter permease [Treponema sp.]